eukprot:GEMP01024533.1.p1 GENE.GEMP01024533.1~~GEMP01024533.1.p1  ORF type:complete len:684 (+),score=115.14 GEMP01024533.1:211-2262(+)
MQGEGRGGSPHVMAVQPNQPTGTYAGVVEEVSSYHVWLQLQPVSECRHILAKKEREALSLAWQSILRSLLQQGQEHAGDEEVAKLVISGIARVAAANSGGFACLKSEPDCVLIVEGLIRAHQECRALVNDGMWALCCLDIEAMMRVCGDEHLGAKKSVQRAAMWALSMLPSIRNLDMHAVPSWSSRIFFAKTAADSLRYCWETWESDTAVHCISVIGYMLRAHLPDTNHDEASHFVDKMVEALSWTGDPSASAVWSLVYICQGNDSAVKKLRNHSAKMCDGLRRASIGDEIRAFAILCGLVGGIVGLTELVETFMEYPKTLENLLFVILENDSPPMNALYPHIVTIMEKYQQREEILRHAVKIIGRIAEWTADAELVAKCIDVLKHTAQSDSEYWYYVRCTAFLSLCDLAAKYPSQCMVESDLRDATGQMLTSKLRLLGILQGPQCLVAFLDEAKSEQHLLDQRLLSCCFAWWELENEAEGALRVHADAILLVVTQILEDKVGTLNPDADCAAATIVGHASAYCTVPLERGLSQMIQSSRRLPIAEKEYCLNITGAITKLIQYRGVDATQLLMKLDAEKLMVQWVQDHPDNLEIQYDVLLVLGMITRQASAILEAMARFDHLAVQCAGCKALFELYRLGYQFSMDERTLATRLISRAEGLEVCAANNSFRTHAAAAYGAFMST